MENPQSICGLVVVVVIVVFVAVVGGFMIQMAPGWTLKSMYHALWSWDEEVVVGRIVYVVGVVKA